MLADKLRAPPALKLCAYQSPTVSVSVDVEITITITRQIKTSKTCWFNVNIYKESEIKMK